MDCYYDDLEYRDLMDSNEWVVVDSELMWDPVMIQYCYRQEFDSLRFRALKETR